MYENKGPIFDKRKEIYRKEVTNQQDDPVLPNRINSVDRAEQWQDRANKGLMQLPHHIMTAISVESLVSIMLNTMRGFALTATSGRM